MYCITSMVSVSVPSSKKHAIPGGCAFLLLPPEEHIGAKHLVRVRCNCGLVAFEVIRGFLAAVLFNRRPPGCLGHFPVAYGPPFGHHVRFVESHFFHVLAAG